MLFYTKLLYLTTKLQNQDKAQAAMLAMQTILLQELGENQLTGDNWIDCFPNFLVYTINCLFDFSLLVLVLLQNCKNWIRIN